MMGKSTVSLAADLSGDDPVTFKKMVVDKNIEALQQI